MTEKTEKREYWVLVLNGLYLLDGEGIRLSRSSRGARKFQDKESAFLFAYGDRERRGDTAAQKMCGLLQCKPEPVEMGATEARMLGLEITSVIENHRINVKVPDKFG